MLYIVLTFKVIKRVVSLQFYTYIMPCPILLFLKGGSNPNDKYFFYQKELYEP